MTIKEHFRRNIHLAYPVVLAQLGHIMVSVADTMMVGQVGVVPLAAATFAGAFFHVLMLFAIGVSYAITPLVAATDPKDQSKLMTYLQNGLALNMTVILFLALLGIFASYFLSYFGQDAAVALEAENYLRIVSFSLIPLMVFQTFRQFSEGLSDTFTPMVLSVIANLLNIVLNYLLIYGHFGFPELGLDGAGFATLISRVVMAVLMFFGVRKYMIGFKNTWSRKVISQMLKIGVPSGLQYIFEVGAFATATIMMGWISAEALAAHQIALNLSAITYMSSTGIAAAATVRIGNQMGHQDLKNLKIAGYSNLVLVAAFMFLMGILMINFRDFLTSLYINEVVVAELASGLLIIAAAFQVSDGLQAVGLGVLRGLTDTKVPTIVTFCAFWLVAIPGGYLLGFIFDLGPFGIWIALLLGLTLAALAHIYRFYSLIKKIIF
ncbi:MAG: MATE family efflux transporter [Cyclobacteriaceae bacterium]